MLHLTTLLLQIGIILIVARAVGWMFQKIHQPQVVGEMVAGIVLGPSLLGWLAPDVSAVLFPAESLGFLNALSQIGLLVFMFLTGLELDPQILRARGRAAVLTSNASILVPFLLGSLLALYLYPHLSDSSVNFTHFALFVGTAMSITAFPVLARILTERKLMRSQVGTVAITCAAVDDVSAWCILAGVVVLVRADQTSMPLWQTLIGVGAFVVAAITVVRPLLKRLDNAYERHGVISQTTLALILLMMLASAWITEQLGIHALFGAFLAGAVMPKRHDFVQALTEKLQDVTVVLLLPLFFALTGLRTSFGLVSGAEMWFFCLLIISVAIGGKFIGAMIPSRLSGMNWRDAGAIGILMNTRGLVELVVLNIGLDIGILSPTLFAMMVLMALVTTFMTSPLLEWVYLAPLRRQALARTDIGSPERIIQKG